MFFVSHLAGNFGIGVASDTPVVVSAFVHGNRRVFEIDARVSETCR